MAISKILLKALKAISYSNIELSKNYKLLRAFEETVHKIDTVRGVNIINEKIADIPVRVFASDKLNREETIVFIHGGGWISGSINSYDATCANISKITGSRVISIEYGLAPENKFPGALNECYNVIKEIIKFYKIFGKNQEKIVLMGDSAGGNLVASVSLMVRDKGEFSISKQVLLYPVVNNDYSDNSKFDSVRENGKDYVLTAKHMQEYVELYIRDKEDLLNPYMAPVLSKNFSNQPNTLIITSEYDPLRDEGEAYGEKLFKAGNYVEVYRIPDALHGFIMLSPRLSPVKKAYEHINSFLDLK